MSISELKAAITEVKEDSIVLKIKEENKTIEKTKIQFRGSPAPQFLINSSIYLIVKLENNQIIEASVDPEIEIKAFFGKIKSFNPSLKTVAIYNFEDSFECPANEFYFMDNSKVPLNHISDHIESHIVAYFKSNSFLEAKIIERDTILTLSLDSIKNNHHIFVFLKDNWQIINTIPRDQVFFKNTNQCPTIENIKELHEKEVKVFVKDDKLRAEIEDLDKSQNYMKSQAYNAKKGIHKTMLEIEESKCKIDDEIFDDDDDYYYRPTRFGSSKDNLPADSKIKSTRKVTPVFATRLLFKDFYPSGFTWYKQSQQFNKASWVIFVGICESTFRFPNSYIRESFKNSLIKTMNSLGQANNEQYFEWLVSLGETKNEYSLEKLHAYLSKYAEFYNFYADSIIGEIDFQKLAEEYHICFNIYKGQFNNPENTIILPITYEEYYPVISLYIDTIFYLTYSDLVMKYDGFNLKTLQVGYKNSVNLDWPLVYKPEKKHIDFYNLLLNIGEIQQFIKSPNNITPSKFNISNEKLVKSIEVCKESFDINCQRSLKFIEVIKDTKIEKLGKIFLCKCGEICDGILVCNSCGSLCNKCELCAIRTEYCLYCNNRLKEIKKEYLIMCDKCGKLEKNSDAMGFCCRCVFCRKCIEEVYSLGKCYCKRDFDNNDEYCVNEFLHK
ncbi:hypothetical protein SteCoe_7075 [Stentor coeruleus]|uniref:Uncharacterized protein n=1 Tax=Stentor coeruleus TaxID=5963 RepID=A0A1R2CNI6_9CILI|nr:hypothetical protein SteCoe_12430 [Stentor coeruleus]OMJ90578.1 hypothetical protein SteCoe_7075 [Stentor coeruleus]